MTDFYVGVTDISPDKMRPSPIPPNFKVCSHYAGEVAQGARERIACSTPVSGRHVIIQLTTPGVPLSFCEVQVYGGELYTTEYVCVLYVVQNGPPHSSI